MKKFDMIMLATGIISLVLSIVTFIVLVFVFVGAVNSEIKSGKVEEGIREIASQFDDSFEFLDDNGIHISSEGTVVDINSNGINVTSSDGSVVDIGSNGINVAPGEG